MKRRLSIGMLAAAVAGAVLASGCSSRKSNFISITFKPTGSISVDLGQVLQIQATVTGDASNKGVTWSFSDTNCTSATCGTLSNNQPFAVTYTAPTGLVAPKNVSIKATAVVSNSANTTVTVNVVLAPTITPPFTLPNGENGLAYRATITVTGGVPPLHFSVISGSLPPGIHLSSSGTFSGTPSSFGTSPFTVQVADSGSAPPVAQAYSITISPPTPLSFNMTSLAPGSVGNPYNAPLIANGGVPPLTWGLTGILPANLTLDTVKGQISGTPTAQGTSSFTITVMDSAIPQQSQSQNLSITINPPSALSITTPSLPGGITATGYQATVQTSGGVLPLSFTVSTGLLPQGLSLDPLSGVITGLPNRAGASNFTVTVADAESVPLTASMNYSIDVTANSLPANNNLLLNGTYAFLFNGFGKAADGSTVPLAEIGIIQPNGKGQINAGIEDIHSNSIVSALPVMGSYNMMADGRGTMILRTNNNGIELQRTYDLSIDSSGNGRFIETDSTGNRGTGILKKQSATAFGTANINGDYAFGFSGYDSNGKHSVMAGVFHADGVSTITKGTADINDNGTMTNALLNSVTGSFTLQSDGRGQASLFVSPTNLGYIMYIISPKDLFFMSANQTVGTTTSLSPISSGEAILQSTQPFSNASLGGTGSGRYVASGTGFNASGDSSIFGGLFAADGNGNITPEATDQNDAGTITSMGQAPAGTYSAISNGRVNFNGIGSRVNIGYLVSSSSGFFIGSDAEATEGLLELQSGGPNFALTSLQGELTLGTGLGRDRMMSNIAGVAAGDGAGGITGTTDSASSTGTVNSGQALTATYSVTASGPTAGHGLVAVGSGTALPASLALYIVSLGNFRLISTDAGDAHPEIFFLDH